MKLGTDLRDMKSQNKEYEKALDSRKVKKHIALYSFLSTVLAH